MRNAACLRIIDLGCGHLSFIYKLTYQPYLVVCKVSPRNLSLNAHP